MILYASAGGGHLSASRAIAKAIKMKDPQSQVEIVDVLSFTPFIFRLIYANGYLFLANRIPFLWGLLFTAKEDFSNISKGSIFYRFFMRIIAWKFIKYVLNRKPDAIIFTHFLPAKIIQDVKERKKLNFLTALCITDYGIHSIWITPGIDFYFLPAEQMRREVMENIDKIGTKRENLLVSGIPTELKFSKEIDREKILSNLHFSKDFPVILFYAGLLNFRNIKKILLNILFLEIPYQLILIVGKKEKIMKKVEEFLKNTRDLNLKSWKVFKFVNNMEELLSISSIILTKAGGLITTEALQKGAIPFLIENYPGQEERNADFLLEEGLAIKINQYSSLRYKILKILKNPDRLREMREKGMKFSKGDSAVNIARKILEVLKNWNSRSICQN